VIHNELASSIEQVSQRPLAVRPLEDVALLHSLPGKLAPLPAQFIAPVREFLFFFQIRLASVKPFRR
jgi:hypothetical protein